MKGRQLPHLDKAGGGQGRLAAAKRQVVRGSGLLGKR